MVFLVGDAAADRTVVNEGVLQLDAFMPQIVACTPRPSKVSMPITPSASNDASLAQNTPYHRKPG